VVPLGVVPSRFAATIEDSVVAVVVRGKIRVPPFFLVWFGLVVLLVIWGVSWGCWGFMCLGLVGCRVRGGGYDCGECWFGHWVGTDGGDLGGGVCMCVVRGDWGWRVLAVARGLRWGVGGGIGGGGVGVWGVGACGGGGGCLGGGVSGWGGGMGGCLVWRLGFGGGCFWAGGGCVERLGWEGKGGDGVVGGCGWLVRIKGGACWVGLGVGGGRSWVVVGAFGGGGCMGLWGGVGWLCGGVGLGGCVWWCGGVCGVWEGEGVSGGVWKEGEGGKGGGVGVTGG